MMRERTSFPRLLLIILRIVNDLKYIDAAPSILSPPTDESETLAHDVSLNTFLATQVVASGVSSYTLTSSPDENVFEAHQTDFPTLKIKIIAAPTPGATYTLTVTAVAADSTTATRTITVTVTTAGPPNDHAPVFQALSGPFKVLTDASIGTEIVTVVATDDDTTSPENDVTYSIPGGTQYSINGTSGSITVASALTYSVTPVELVVTATDGGTPQKSASVTVTVSTVTRPVWTTPAAGSTASQSISELITTPEDIYTLAATDEDNSGTLTYTIAPPDNSKFTVVGDKLRAIANGSFDVDAANADRAYTLTVSVSDGEYSAATDAMINITLTDENDLSPVFDPAEYTVSLTSNINNGDTICTVTANDGDYTAVNNVVTYSLLPADDTVFSIDSSTGEITLDNKTSLSDYVTSQSLVAYAKDNGTPQKNASATVTIKSDLLFLCLTNGPTQPSPLWTLPGLMVCSNSGIKVTKKDKLVFSGVSEINCDQPPAPDQGTVALTGTETTYQATATQSCNTGYNRSTGDGTITCEADGSWSTSYTCTIVDCGQPLAPDQGTVALTGTETTYQATATQSCNTGYNRSTGDGTITCQASGFWSTSYTCAIVDCGQPSPPDQGTVALTGTETTYLATATQSCNTGYNRSTGDGSITCEASGSWSTSYTCTIVDCGQPSAPEQGTVALTGTETTYQATATQSCNTGYSRSTGDGTITCEASGSWSTSYSCTIEDCGQPSAPDHGTVALTGTETTYEATATQSCNTGYSRSTGDGTITCQANGSWSTSYTCTIVDCGQPPAPDQGTVALTGTETTYQATATQSCNTGYSRSTGDGTITCQANGSWSTSYTCTIVDCGQPPAPDQGKVVLTGTETTYQATATQSCNTGYNRSTGDGTIKCEANGSWSTSYTCTIVDCGQPPAPDHGTVTLTGTVTTYLATSTQSCNTGYNRVSGTGPITCLETGLWSTSITCTIADCGTPSTPNHGSVSLNGNVTTYQATATQTCDTGYYPSTATLTCLASGSWSASICSIVDCGVPATPDHGSFTLNGSVTTYQATATQSCNKRYYLSSGPGVITCLVNGSWSAYSVCSFIETTTSAAKDQNAHITIPVVVGVTIGVLVIGAIAVTIFVKTSLLTKPHVKHPSYKYSNHTKPSSRRYLDSEGLRWQQNNFHEYLNNGYSGNNVY